MTVGKLIQTLQSMKAMDSEVIILDHLTGVVTKPELVSLNTDNKVVIIEKSYFEYRARREREITDAEAKEAANGK